MKSTFIKLNVLIVTSLLSVNAAFGGTKDSGGDPYVQQFINRAKKICDYFKGNRAMVSSVLDIDSFCQTVSQIDSSIKDEGVADLLEFTDEILKDKDGVNKPAIFNPETGFIRVNRAAWASLDPGDRLNLVALEISGILNIEARYEKIERLLRDKADLIESIPDAAVEAYQGPNRRLVGSDPGIFSSISNQDILIDGGVMGSGSEQTQNMIAFMQDWKSNPELFDQMIRPLLDGKRVFLVIHSIHGNYATVGKLTLSRDKEPSRDGRHHSKFEVYLMHFKKTRSIYGGVCAQEAPNLTSLERIRQCYLNLDLYQPQDDRVTGHFTDGMTTDQIGHSIQKVFTDLYESLLFQYARNKANLRSALREYLIVDYSMVSRSGDDRVLMEAAARAEGLVPSLVGPFSQPEFWVESDSVDYGSVRLSRGAKIAVENRLLFFSANFHCQEISSELPEIQGPFLIDRERVAKYIEARACSSYRMGYDFEESFLRALSEAGFWYDGKQKTWLKGEGASAPTEISNDLSLRELEFRITTERWTFDDVVTILTQKRDATESVKERLILSTLMATQLGKLAFPDQSIDFVYQDIIKDIKTKDYDIADFSIESVFNYLFRRASCVEGMSPEMAREIIDTVLTDPNTQKETLKELLYANIYWTTRECTYPFFEDIFLRTIDHPQFDIEGAKDLAIHMIDGFPWCRLENCDGAGKSKSFKGRAQVLRKLVEKNYVSEELKPLALRTITILDATKDFETHMSLETARPMIEALGLGAVKPVLVWFLDQDVPYEVRVEALNFILDHQGASSPLDALFFLSRREGNAVALWKYAFSYKVEPLPPALVERILRLAIEVSRGPEPVAVSFRYGMAYDLRYSSRTELKLDWEGIWREFIETAVKENENALKIFSESLRLCYEKQRHESKPVVCQIKGAARRLAQKLIEVDGVSENFRSSVAEVLALAHD
jgi:hypothetical protein